jgi:DNA mismatch endonuclease (patch repair protein)
MQGNRSDSRLEQRLRRELHGRGLRFRKHVGVLPGSSCRPDVVFSRAKVAVFVDGCFWHSCPIHATSAKANAAWWKSKLAGNVERDRRNDHALADAGWTVLRFWEHEPVASMADRIAAVLADPPTAAGT